MEVGYSKEIHIMTKTGGFDTSIESEEIEITAIAEVGEETYNSNDYSTMILQSKSDYEYEFYGDPEKDRKPIQPFIQEVNKYPGLLDIIMAIDGTVNKRSSHASGVILYEDDPFDTASIMRTPSGDLITCYDLHDAEYAGDTKYDILSTEISDKIIQCYNLLLENHEIPQLTLKEFYDQYLHPEVMDTENPELWKHLAAGDVLDVFQFNEGSGLAIAKKLKPKDPIEMTAANALMRLMNEKGVESQQDRYVRIQKQGIEVFDSEMRSHHLPDRIIELMHKHCDQYYGCCMLQEKMMEILMDVANFTLGEANSARKVVAKKQMDKIPALKEQFYSKLADIPKEGADYLWSIVVAPSLGYAFSLCHSLPYSFVGMQTLLLATKFNPIYWNTACLIVNSGATDVDAKGATNYKKIAKAVGDIISAGVKVSLLDINSSDYGFKPDVENNQIIFGMKGVQGLGNQFIQSIIQNRPYSSPKDFLMKVKPNKQTMLALIKGGAFDSMMDRKLCLGWYLYTTCKTKERLTLQNMSTLIKLQMIPQELQKEKSIYEFNRYLKHIEYKLDQRAIDFLMKIEAEEFIQDDLTVNPKLWDKFYQKALDPLRDWLKTNQEDLLHKINGILFQEEWKKYTGRGNISSWEMDSLCFYYHDHELANIRNDLYGFKNFEKLPREPVVERVWQAKNISIYHLDMICGTCIAKNKEKSTATILTPNGVVDVKFRKEYFSLFNKQISVRDADGTKHIIEHSWFNKGSMIAVTGMRSGDDFIAKTYKSTPTHTLYKIDAVNADGTIQMRHERYTGIEEEEEDEQN